MTKTKVLSAATLVIAGWFYAWMPASFPRRWIASRPATPYQELTAALRAGHLHLLLPPDPALARLRDPYDPDQNQPYRIDNLSYFAGHYYVYHGIGPVLTLYLPFRLATGRHLTDAAAAWLFCLAGLAGSMVFLAQLHRRHFSQASLSLVACGLTALALGQGYYAVLRGATTNSVAIAAAGCFLSWALVGIAAALAAERRAAWWLGLASLSYGLAVASRPNYLAGAIVLLAPVAARWRRPSPGPGAPRLLLLAAAALVPAGLVGSGLLLYNYLRFGQPLEFGPRYMLGAWNQQLLPALGTGNLALNAWHYLVAPARYHADFPFVTAPSWLATGVLLQAPIVWLALGAAAWFRPLFGRTPPAGVAVGAVLLAGAANLGTLLLLPSGSPDAASSANVRYLYDFLPPFVLAAAAAALAAGHAWAAQPRRRRWLIGATAGLTLATALVALSLDFEHFPPESYRGFAGILDTPTALVQRLLGIAYGPVRLDLEFPGGQAGRREPLLATGTSEGGDLVFVDYLADNRVRFGVVGIGIAGPVSEPVRLAPGTRHTIDVSLGSLYPPVGHPLLRRLTDAQISYLKRRVHLTVDGATVFDAWAHSYPSSPRDLAIGAAPFLLDPRAGRFTGRIFSVHRLPVTAPADSSLIQAPRFGPVRLTVRFPADPPRIPEPLLATGVAQAGDVVYVAYRADHHIRLGLDDWGHPSHESNWLPVDLAAEHTVEISMGSLFPSAPDADVDTLAPAARGRKKAQVKISLDGRVVLAADQDTYESPPYDVIAGTNVIGATSCGYAFTGEIREVRRLPPGAEP